MRSESNSGFVLSTKQRCRRWTLFFLHVTWIILWSVVLLQQAHGSNDDAGFFGAESKAALASVTSDLTTDRACEGEKLNLSCAAAFRIRIIRANYGRFSLNVCNENGIDVANTQCIFAEALDVVAKLCNARSECSVVATNELFEDRCPETPKYLEVVYECIHSKPPRITVTDHSAETQQADPPSIIPSAMVQTTTTAAEAVTNAAFGADISATTSSLYREHKAPEKILAVDEPPPEMLPELIPSTTFEPIIFNYSASYCPETTFRGVTWLPTLLGYPCRRPCPNNPLEFAEWRCGHDQKWTPARPDFSRCASIWVKTLQEKVKESFIQEAPPTHIAPIILSSNLKSARDPTKPLQTLMSIKTDMAAGDLYGPDTQIVAAELHRIIKFTCERSQLAFVGSGLSHADQQEYWRMLGQQVLEIGSELLTPRNKESWQDLNSAEQTKSAVSIVDSLEKYGQTVAAFELLRPTNRDGGAELSEASEHISMKLNLIAAKSTAASSALIAYGLQSSGNHSMDSVMLPYDALLEKGWPANDSETKLFLASYDNVIGNYMKSEQTTDIFASSELRRQKVVSRLLTVSIMGHSWTGSVKDLSAPVLITLAIVDKPLNGSNPRCVFWKQLAANGSGDWSTEGCSIAQQNETHVVCACDHLTNFAILMDVAGIELELAHELALVSITYFGCMISVVCLTVAILCFHCLRSLESERTTIHKNLCICLAIAEIVFLVGIGQTRSKIGCGIIAGILHYFFLATFAWSLLEGFQLYVLLVEVFEASEARRKYFYLFGYGVPGIIVGLSAALAHDCYGTESYCWLSTSRNFVYSFVGPVLAVILVNMIFLTMAVIIMCKHYDSQLIYRSSTPVRPIIDHQISGWIRGGLALVFLLGLTWTLAFFYISNTTLVFAYAFTILNSLQGLFIFIFYVALDKKVRKEFQTWLKRDNSLPKPFRDFILTATESNNSSSCDAVKPQSNSLPAPRNASHSPEDSLKAMESRRSRLSRLFQLARKPKRTSAQFLLARPALANSCLSPNACSLDFVSIYGFPPSMTTSGLSSFTQTTTMDSLIIPSANDESLLKPDKRSFMSDYSGDSGYCKSSVSGDQFADLTRAHLNETHQFTVYQLASMIPPPAFPPPPIPDSTRLHSCNERCRYNSNDDSVAQTDCSIYHSPLDDSAGYASEDRSVPQFSCYEHYTPSTSPYCQIRSQPRKLTADKLTSTEDDEILYYTGSCASSVGSESLVRRTRKQSLRLEYAKNDDPLLSEESQASPRIQQHCQSLPKGLLRKIHYDGLCKAEAEATIRGHSRARRKRAGHNNNNSHNNNNTRCSTNDYESVSAPEDEANEAELSFDSQDHPADDHQTQASRCQILARNDDLKRRTTDSASTSSYPDKKHGLAFFAQPLRRQKRYKSCRH